MTKIVRLKAVLHRTARSLRGTAILLSLAVAPAAAEAVSLKPADMTALTSAGIKVKGKLVRAFQISDQAGEHILVLSKQTGASLQQPDEENARTDLEVGYYSPTATRWVREWAMFDAVDCPTLDHHALFFGNHVTVTDLDKNGMAEVTVTYKMFCGGGIDEDDLKIILRQGDQKFAMRGRTRTVSKEGGVYGGEAMYDKSLSLKANAVFRKHIEGVREKVVTTRQE